MANHLRRQIRDAAAALIAAGATAAGSRVYAGRRTPLATASLPAVCVFTDDEEVEVLSIHGPHKQQRTIRLAVRLLAADGATAPQDALDALSVQVEALLGAAGALSTVCRALSLSSAAFEPAEETAGAVEALTLSYVATVTAAANAPDVLT